MSATSKSGANSNPEKPSAPTRDFQQSRKNRLLARLNNFVYLDLFRPQRLSHFQLLTKHHPSCRETRRDSHIGRQAAQDTLYSPGRIPLFYSTQMDPMTFATAMLDKIKDNTSPPHPRVQRTFAHTKRPHAFLL